MRRISPYRFALALAGASVLTLVSCREGVPPFAAEDETAPDDASVLRLTASTGNDRNPVWAPDGSAILYHAGEFTSATAVTGALVRIPQPGRTASLLLEDVQTVQSRVRLATPVPSPDNQKIAYFDIVRMSPVDQCEGPPTSPWAFECINVHPQLETAILRVRQLGTNSPVSTDPALLVPIPGPDPRLFHRQGSPYASNVFPFQHNFSNVGVMQVRPTWAPDNQRVAFSDGLRILVWQVGSAEAVPVPGSEDGVSPAWSPDGQWLAFTRLLRTDSGTVACSCAVGQIIDTQNRTYYDWTPQLVVMRPDGTDLRELGPGDEPAWSPDGQTLYFVTDEGIARIPVAGGAATPVTGAERGRSPAVSPDGRWLAFSRLKLNQEIVDHDIWIARL